MKKRARNKKAMTIEGLALMVQGGFGQSRKEFSRLHATDELFAKEFGRVHEEFSRLHATDELFAKEFNRIHETHKLFADEFRLIRSDIHDIKGTLGPLVRMYAAQEREVTDLKIRVNRLERKAGISHT